MWVNFELCVEYSKGHQSWSQKADVAHSAVSQNIFYLQKQLFKVSLL